MKEFLRKKLGIEVSFTTGDNPCIHIHNSYRVTDRKFIRYALECIHYMPEYKALQGTGYTRTLKSEYREWRAHNLLFRLGIFKERTGTADIAQNESILRRIGYAILSIF